MSLELIATIICDNCQLRAPSGVETKFTMSNVVATCHKHALMKVGWVTLNRGRFHVEAHYCPQCADKPIKPLKGKPRWKGPEVTVEIRAALHPRLTAPDNKRVWILVEGAKRLTIGTPCRCHSELGTSTYWQLKGHRKNFKNSQISGWITQPELTALLGKDALAR